MKCVATITPFLWVTFSMNKAPLKLIELKGWKTTTVVDDGPYRAGVGVRLAHNGNA